MSDPESSASTVDVSLATELRAGMAAIGVAPPEGAPTMSETSIDGTILLDTIGLEPIDFVFGLGARSFPYGIWIGGKGRSEIDAASQVLELAIADALNSARSKAMAAEATGVIGLQVTTRLHLHYVSVEVKGTAVRSIKRPKSPPTQTFATDLSARDLVVLDDAGWAPIDLVYGSSFAVVRYQARVKYSENIEMENMTNALYLAREKSVAKLQRKAVALKAEGVVGTTIDEQLHGMLTYRVLGFRAVGTCIARTRKGASIQPPTLALSMDEGDREFDVAALRGSSADLLRYRDPSPSDVRDFSDSASTGIWRAFGGAG